MHVDSGGGGEGGGGLEERGRDGKEEGEDEVRTREKKRGMSDGGRGRG